MIFDDVVTMKTNSLRHNCPRHVPGAAWSSARRHWNKNKSKMFHLLWSIASRRVLSHRYGCRVWIIQSSLRSWQQIDTWAITINDASEIRRLNVTSYRIWNAFHRFSIFGFSCESCEKFSPSDGFAFMSPKHVKLFEAFSLFVSTLDSRMFDFDCLITYLRGRWWKATQEIVNERVEWIRSDSIGLLINYQLRCWNWSFCVEL